MDELVTLCICARDTLVANCPVHGDALGRGRVEYTPPPTSPPPKPDDALRSVLPAGLHERRLCEEMAAIIESRWASGNVSLHEGVVELLIDHEQTKRVRDSYVSALAFERDLSARAYDALRYIVAHPNGVGDHHPSAVATAVLNGEEIPNV